MLLLFLTLFLLSIQYLKPFRLLCRLLIQVTSFLGVLKPTWFVLTYLSRWFIGSCFWFSSMLIEQEKLEPARSFKLSCTKRDHFSIDCVVSRNVIVTKFNMFWLYVFYLMKSERVISVYFLQDFWFCVNVRPVIVALVFPKSPMFLLSFLDKETNIFPSLITKALHQVHFTFKACILFDLDPLREIYYVFSHPYFYSIFNYAVLQEPRVELILLLHLCKKFLVKFLCLYWFLRLF